MMTEWLPVLSLQQRGGIRHSTKHKALTEAIIADIDAGRLARGDRLPTHRELALRLGVSVQTVSASYKEVERQGYLRSEVGIQQARSWEPRGGSVWRRSPARTMSTS